MTKNNAFKKQVREWMERTGEPYVLAARHVEEFNQTILWELGEDGGSWFVEGTLNEDIAKQRTIQWAIEVYDHDMLEFSDTWTYQPKEDWYFSPVREEYPDDDCLLVFKSQDETRYKGEPLMKGVWVRD